MKKRQMLSYTVYLWSPHAPGSYNVFCIFLLDLIELHLYTVDEHVMLTLMQGSSNVHQIYYISVLGKTDSTAV